MGCDIHLFLETADYLEKDGKTKHWYFKGQLYPGRHYGMFAKMAGVRNYPEFGIVPIAEPKGLPADLGWWTSSEINFYIVDRPDPNFEVDWCERAVSKDQAHQWVSDGISKYVDVDKTKVITHPDFHSHSWLSTEEFQQCVNDPKAEASVGWKAILSMMKTYEKAGIEARLVFAFDN